MDINNINTNISNIDLTEAFLNNVKDCSELVEATKIVKDNSSGNIWLIGGFVYRSIASELYGISKPEVDIDFIVEHHFTEFSLPPGWIVSTNRFGNVKFVNGKKSIDYVPLTNIYSIIHRQLEPTIENFLTGAPLNIQSIVYDVDNNKIIGDIGIDALMTRTVAVHDLYYAEYAAKMAAKKESEQNVPKKKATTVNGMIKEKAEALGFMPIYYY